MYERARAWASVDANERVRQEAKGEAAELARLTKENTALKARSAASRHHALIHLRHRGLTLG